MLIHVVAQSRYRYHPVARAWMNAVEAADGQTLEVGVRKAYHELIVDLEGSSILSAIATMVVKQGARTLAGALVDVITPNSSWANTGFVQGDYNRTTGLIGNGTSKYLSSGRSNNTDGQNNFAMWNYVTAIAGTNAMRYMGGGGTAENGCSIISRSSATALQLFCRENDGSLDAGANAVGLVGVSRAASNSFTSYGGGASNSNLTTSETPANRTIFEYATNNGGAAQGFSNHRSSAAAIGAAMNLTTVQTIMDAFAAKIAALGL